MAIRSEVTLKVGDAGGAGSLTEVGCLTDFSGPSPTTETIDVTCLDPNIKYRQKIIGKIDSGEFTCTVNLDPDATNNSQDLQSRLDSRTKSSFELTLADTVTPTTITWDGYVTGFSISGSEGSAVTAEVTVAIDGKATWATT